MQVPQKQTVDIDFRDITYTVNRKQPNHILKGVNGHFRAGNLIGILGPSGAGKTTLLNILAGYNKNSNADGVINVNGELRDMRKFRKLSCYIMQEDVVQKQLSVDEIMALAADLKLGHRFTTKEKCKIINSILNVIGLKSCRKTRTESLSGGELKRLSIALELISNPPVMFLDEPTTGLDNVVAKQCIELLKVLANQGRTIICTIHQPPDSLFSLFDQVYFLANGRCVYNGSVSQMVPLLEDVSLTCPTTYSPADYIIEVVYNNEEMIDTLSKIGKNGLLTRYNPKNESTKSVFRQHTLDALFAKQDQKKEESFANSYHTQVIILLRRMLVQIFRNRLMMIIQLVHHLISGLSLGLSFFWIGNDGAQAMANFKFLLALIVFYCYTYIMSPALLFPFEVQLIKREYFNRWYSLKSYFTALCLSTLPVTIILSILFNLIIYTLTNQPMEMRRFFFFNLICILTGINSYGLGITLGTLFNSTTAACVGSTIGIYLISICIQGLGYRNAVPTATKILMYTTYPRHALTGFSIALFRDRPLMECSDEFFCHVRDPQDILQLMGMEEAKLDVSIYVLTICAIFLRAIAYIALRRKVAYDSNIICKYF